MGKRRGDETEKDRRSERSGEVDSSHADERFERAHADPRFRRLPKVYEELDEADQRFQKLRTDPAFARYGEFQLPQQHSEGNREASSGSFLPGIRGSVSPPETSSDDESGSDGEDQVNNTREGSTVALAPDENVIAHYIARENEADSSLQRIREGSETSRLAVLDLDWDNISAADIFAFLSSFCGPNGRLLSVTVKPTQLGMERLSEEVPKGPSEIVSGDSGKDIRNEDDNDQAEEDAEAIEDHEALERVREYERQKLRYYFAITEFDSASTANIVYSECDGTEFERSGNVIDLRFIPDDRSFDDRPVKESAKSIPSGYRPPRFETKALQHSQAVLSWDRNDSHRKNALQRRPTDSSLKDDDVKAYLASESEDEDYTDERAIAEKYKSLLLGNSKGKNDVDKMQEAASDARRHAYGTKSKDKGDLHVTFSTGIDEIGKRAQEGNAQASKSVFEQRREKKRLDKQRQREEQAASKQAQNDVGFDDPFFQQAGNGDIDDAPSSDDGGKGDTDDQRYGNESVSALRRSQGRKPNRKHKSELMKARKALEEQERDEEQASEQTRADAEMLTIDDAALREGRPYAAQRADDEEPQPRQKKKRHESKKQRIRRLREEKERRKRDRRGGNVGEGIDTTDERFQKLFEAPEYALEPTDPRYRDAGSAGTIERERRKRRAQKRGTEEQAEGADVVDKLPGGKRRKM